MSTCTQHPEPKSACSPVRAETATAPETTRRTRHPRADVWETDDAAHVLAEVPGATKEGLSITVEDQRLVVSATVDAPRPEGRCVHAEWSPTDYQRTFLLSRDADTDGITATLRHGLLHLTVPKRPELRPRTIAVQVTD